MTHELDAALLDRVLDIFERLKPYAENADRRVRGSSFDDNARMLAATSIVRSAVMLEGHVSRAASADEGADHQEQERRA